MDPVGMDDLQREVVENELFGHSFQSAEARWEFERTRRRQAVLKSLVGVLLLTVFGYGMYLLGGGGNGSEHGILSGGDDHHRTPQKIDVEPVGSKDAKVQVTAIVPAGSDCHSGIIKFLLDTANPNASTIRVEFRTMEEFSAEDLNAKVGSYCAAVIINDKVDFEVPIADGKVRSISLVGTEPTHFTLDDVGLALTKMYTDAYGPPETPLYVPKNDGCGGSSCATTDGHSHDGKEDDDVELPADGELKLKLPAFGSTEKE